MGRQSVLSIIGSGGDTGSPSAQTASISRSSGSVWVQLQQRKLGFHNHTDGACVNCHGDFKAVKVFKVHLQWDSEETSEARLQVDKDC